LGPHRGADAGAGGPGGAADPHGPGAEAGRVHRPGRGAAVRPDRLARGAELADMSALELTRVSVRHGRRLALEGADLKVAPGEVVAICGPNGAGKTTLLRAGLGLLRPASGEARLFGDPVERLSPPQRAARVGYLAQERRVAWG